MTDEEEFSIAFYAWAKLYAQEEVSRDYKLVRLFEIPEVLCFLEATSVLDESKRCLLANGMVKRFHSWAAAVLKDESRGDESAVVDWYLERIRMSFETGRRHRWRVPAGRPIALPQLRKLVVEHLGQRVGVRRATDVPGCLEYLADYGAVGVRTIILTGSRAALTIHQEVLSASGNRAATCINPLSWLGIIGSPVSWKEVGKNNVEGTLRAICCGCTEFLSAIPSIMEKRKFRSDISLPG
jgi:hypothetical protein